MANAIKQKVAVSNNALTTFQIDPAGNGARIYQIYLGPKGVNDAGAGYSVQLADVSTPGVFAPLINSGTSLAITPVTGTNAVNATDIPSVLQEDNSGLYFVLVGKGTTIKFGSTTGGAFSMITIVYEEL